MFQKLILLLLCTIIPGYLFAQFNQDIDAVEVVALPMNVDVAKSGRSVTILSANDIANLPVQSVEEALRYVAGVNINSRGGFGVQSDVGIRGSTFSQVLFLIDGIRWNEPLTAHLNNSLPISLSDIDKIEIIRGPASGIYGADAVGGVIHIHTKSFGRRNYGLDGAGSMFGGSHKLFSGDGFVQYTTGQVTVSATVKSTTSEGEEFVNPNYELGISDSMNYYTDFDLLNYQFAAQFHPSDKLKFFSRYAKDSRDFNAKYFYTRSAYDESRENTSTDFVQFTSNYGEAGNQTTLNVGYKNTNDDFLFNPLFPENEHQTNRWVAVATHQHEFDEHQVVVGAQYDRQSIESTDRGNHDLYQMDAFASGSFAISENWHSVFSIRGGRNEEFGSFITPQASLTYGWQEGNIHASIGRAVRAPDFTERYVSYNIPELSPGRNVGNPDLKAEQSMSYDVGIDWLFPQNIQLSSSLFYRNSKELIDYTIVNADDVHNVDNLIDGENYFQATNIGEAKTTGVEWQGSYRYNLYGDIFRYIATDVNYTFLHTVLSSDEESKYLANHPKHQLNLGLRLHFDEFTLHYMNQYIRRNEEAVQQINAEVPSSYWIGNISANVKLWNEFAVQVNINNLYDTSYEEILGARMPSRWYSFGLRYNLD